MKNNTWMPGIDCIGKPRLLQWTRWRMRRTTGRYTCISDATVLDKESGIVYILWTPLAAREQQSSLLIDGVMGVI